MDTSLSYTSSVTETVRDLQLEIHETKNQQKNDVAKLNNKIQNLEEALNTLIASNSLVFGSFRLPNGFNTKLVLKGKSAPNAVKALSLVRNLLADNLNLDEDLTKELRSAELQGTDDILFDAGSIVNKVKILARSQALGTGGNVNLNIQNYN